MLDNILKVSLHNILWEFRHICNFSTVGHKAVEISGIFSGMHGYILMKLIKITRHQVHVTVMTFSRS